MKVKQAEEWSEIEIPLSEIVGENGILKISPNVTKYFSISYKPNSDKLKLIAGGFIGFIPINNELAVNINPKFPIINLTHIISVAEANIKVLDFFNKKYQEQNILSLAMFEFMVDSFVDKLQTLETEGILKDYILKKEHGHNIRGRININESVKFLWSHGHFNKVATSHYDLTLNNPFNKLIKFTLKFCIEELKIINSARVDLRQILINFYVMFDAVSIVDNLHEFDDVFSAIENDKVTELRNYYISICLLCKLIINRTGVSFDKNIGGLDLKSFVFNMASVFENYLLNIIRLHRNLLPNNTVILNGNKEGRKKLFNYPSYSNSDAKPDIILKINNKFRIIIDAKYKFRPKDSDRYQIITHALSYNATVAILVIPKDNTHIGASLVKIGNIGNDYNIDVYEYYFNLANIDLISEEESLSNTILQIINSNE